MTDLTETVPNSSNIRPALRISVVIPLYNEEAVIDELLARVLDVFDELPGGPHELVLVNDGSRDRTMAAVRQAVSRDDRIVAVDLSRNFGHQLALSAGLDHATGDVVVMMDGDLQDRPEAIPIFLDAWANGADVVYAVRERRKESWLLRACYRSFYRTISRMSDLRLPEDAGDFCLMSREVTDAIINAHESHRYLRGLRAWAGYTQVGIPVERDARFAGEAKYTFRSLFRLAFDGIFSFSTIPLRVASWVGLSIVGVSAALLAFFVVAWSLGYAPQGFTALATSIAFFSGVQLLFLGVIGEYVGRIYQQVKGRPNYLVRSVLKNTTAACSQFETDDVGVPITVSRPVGA